LALTLPKIKAIKQVKLFTRYRELLPLEWRDITCSDPGKEIILGIKGQRNQKAKEYAAAKKQKLEAEAAVQRASQLAIADEDVNIRTKTRNNNTTDDT
jgi:hypothetical protein